MKFCKDCKHVLKSRSDMPLDLARCALSPIIDDVYYMVTGENKFQFCSIVRDGKCGHDAKLFEGK